MVYCYLFPLPNPQLSYRGLAAGSSSPSPHRGEGLGLGERLGVAITLQNQPQQPHRKNSQILGESNHYTEGK